MHFFIFSHRPENLAKETKRPWVDAARSLGDQKTNAISSMYPPSRSRGAVDADKALKRASMTTQNSVAEMGKL